jgi:hypothetical protein
VLAKAIEENSKTSKKINTNIILIFLFISTTFQFFKENKKEKNKQVEG